MLAAAALAACRAATPEGTARASVARPQLDTVRFGATASAYRCRDGRGLLLEAVSDGNGILVWLRSGDSVAGGDYDILGVRDTVTPRGAFVSARYMTGDVAHGFSLDSGTVSLWDSAGRLGAGVRGAGLEVPGALRPFLAADFMGLSAPADSAPCEPQHR